MARSTATQPMVKDSGNLAIGLMKVAAAEINVTTKEFVDHAGVSADSSSIPASAHLFSSHSLGALQEAGLEAVPTFKTHTSGYPKTEDARVIEATSAIFNLTMEELTGTTGLAILDDILDTLNTGTLHYYAVAATSQFAEGDRVDLYAPVTVLKPDLALNLGNDWAGLPISFEAVYKDTFTNNLLLYWDRTAGASRSTDYMPITIDTDDLAIGKMQFRLGKFTNRAAGTAVTMPARKVVNAGGTATVTSSGTYTGTVDGAFVIEVTSSGTPDVFSWTAPDGTLTTGVSVLGPGSPQLLADGVSIVFSSTTASADGDIWVVGVETASALSGGATTIRCEYPYLPYTYSIGAVASSEISTEITYKDHFSGYPEKKTLSILEEVKITPTAAVEEIDLDQRPTTSGQATKLADAIFDSATTGNLYYAPLEIIITMLNGYSLSFWFPNVQIVPNANFAPGDDWANLSVQFSAQLPEFTGATKKIFRLFQNW